LVRTRDLTSVSDSEASDELPYGGALMAVRRIEAALSERDATQRTAEAELASAHEEAERLLANARAAGLRAGLDRRRSLLDAAETDAQAIRAESVAQMDRIRCRTTAARDELVAALTSLLLFEEV
jgi:hypothetical protein